MQLSKSEFASEGICEIGLFPEYAEFLASHVTVRCKRLIYGLTQIEFFDYRIACRGCTLSRGENVSDKSSEESQPHNVSKEKSSKD